VQHEYPTVERVFDNLVEAMDLDNVKLYGPTTIFIDINCNLDAVSKKAFLKV
jgi:hypothetical protein